MSFLVSNLTKRQQMFHKYNFDLLNIYYTVNCTIFSEKKITIFNINNSTIYKYPKL